MEVGIRSVDIFIEVVLLAAVSSCILVGAWLTIFDLGLRPLYKKAVTMALIVIGGFLVIFFISHLISFYPAI